MACFSKGFFLFYRKTLVYELFKVPRFLRDYRLHASICVMTCSLTSLKPMNKPKPALSLIGPLNSVFPNLVTFHFLD